jgi:hypothetical protein
MSLRRHDALTPEQARALGTGTAVTPAIEVVESMGASLCVVEVNGRLAISSQFRAVEFRQSANHD